MTWENVLTQCGIAAADIAGSALMTLASGGMESRGTIISSVIGSVLSGGAGPLMAALGLGNSGNTTTAPDYTPYFNAIESQLSDMESFLFQGLSDIQQSVNWIKAGVTSIEQQIQDSELQALLGDYSDNVSVVDSYLEQYADAVAALKAGTDNSSTAQTMYNLLTNHASDVDIAMRNIYNKVYGQTPENPQLKGILDFQASICQQAVTTWASKSSNLVLANPGQTDDTRGYTPSYDNSLLLTTPFTLIPAPITNSVVPTYQAIIAAMGKGLLFLGAAWQGTINDGMLQLHINNVQSIMQKMNQLWGTLTDPTAVNTMIYTLMNSYRQTVGDLGPVTDVDNSTTPGTQPFASEWAWWQLPGQPNAADDWYNIHSGVANIASTVPPLGGTVDAYYIGTGYGEGSDGISGTVCSQTSVTIPTPDSIIPTSMPTALSNFINSLGSVTPGIFPAASGTTQALTCAWAGEPGTNVKWSITPSDGSAGTVTAGPNNTATYIAPATVSSPFLANIQAEFNGSIQASAWVVLLRQQPNMQITPPFQTLSPSGQLTFTSSAANADVIGSIWTIDGQGPFNGNPAYGTIVGLKYTAPASLTEPGLLLITFDAAAGVDSGYALVALTTS